jgi:hypothetical protein
LHLTAILTSALNDSDTVFVNMLITATKAVFRGVLRRRFVSVDMRVSHGPTAV